MATIFSLGLKRAADDAGQVGNEVTASEEWVLRFNAPTRAVAALVAVNLQGVSFGLPAQGEDHPEMAGLKRLGISFTHKDEQQGIFTLSVDYSNLQEQVNEQSAENPLDRPTSYFPQNVDLFKNVDVDAVTGDPAQNFAGRPFVPALTKNDPIKRWVIVRNEFRWNKRQADKVEGTVNRDNVRIDGENYAAQTCLMEAYTGVPQTDQDGNRYYSVSYTILINPRGHAVQVLNRGTRNAAGNFPSDDVIHSDGAAYLDDDGTFRDPSADPKGIITEINVYDLVSWGLGSL